MGFSLSSLITNLFFPPVCARCSTEGVWLCQACRQTMPEALCRWCPECVTQVDAKHTFRSHGLPFINVYSLLVYQEHWVSKAVHAAKYQGAYRIMRCFGQLLAERMMLAPSDLATTVVSFVPLHVRRRRERGFDQAEELAAAFARNAGLPMVRAVERCRATKSQAMLDGAERRQNLTDAFRPTRSGAGIDQQQGCMISKKNILLVDDVITTGSTVAAVASLLQKLGAQSVTALTIAYSDPRREKEAGKTKTKQTTE